MKPFNGFEAKKQNTREVLPAGGYVAKVIGVAEIKYTWGTVLEIGFDIAEGPQTGFFDADYKSNPNEDRKWRGKFRLTEPTDDGSEDDERTKRRFGGVIFAFEDSNAGFHWDWDEQKLKGLTVGVLFRNKEWAINGNTGWTTECCSMIPAEDVRSGRFKVPKDKPLPEKPKSAFTGRGFEDITDDVPFNL